MLHYLAQAPKLLRSVCVSADAWSGVSGVAGLVESFCYRTLVTAVSNQFQRGGHCPPEMGSVAVLRQKFVKLPLPLMVLLNARQCGFVWFKLGLQPLLNRVFDVLL